MKKPNIQQRKCSACHPLATDTLPLINSFVDHTVFYVGADSRHRFSSSTSINQSINKFITRHSTTTVEINSGVLQCHYRRLKRNVLSRFLKTLTYRAVRQLSGREFQSLGAATEKRRAAMSHSHQSTGPRQFSVGRPPELTVIPAFIFS